MTFTHEQPTLIDSASLWQLVAYLADQRGVATRAEVDRCERSLAFALRNPECPADVVNVASAILAPYQWVMHA
jgi:hypothetical protein